MPRPVAANVATGELLSQASVLSVIAFSLAMIAFSAYRIGLHYGAWAPISISASSVASTMAAPIKGVIAAPVNATNAPAGSVDPALDNTDRSGIGPLPGVSRPAILRSGTWVPVLMYHYIRQVSTRDRMGWNLSVTPRDFEAQMRYLRDNGFNSMTMRDLDVAILEKRPLPSRPVVVTFDDAYRDFYTTAAPILRDVGIKATEYVPTQLIGQPAYMTWTQVQELDAEGFEMAAHTQLHVDLTKQTFARAEVEIAGSKAMLEDYLGHPVVDFAYPSGAFSLEIMQQVQAAGFWSAVTTQNGGYHDSEHMYDSSRIRVTGGESLEGFAYSLRPAAYVDTAPSAESKPTGRQPAPPQPIFHPTAPPSPKGSPKPGPSPTR